MPLARKGSQVETIEGNFSRNLCFNRDQIVWTQIWFEMNECFNRSQGEGSGSVNNLHALAVPATAKESSAFAGKSAGGVNRAADSPQAHLAVNAVGNASKNILDLSCSEVGIELIDGDTACQRTIGGAQPLRGLVGVTDHFNCRRVDASDANGAVGFGGGEARVPAQTTGQGSRRNAELLGERGVFEIEFFTKNEQGTRRQSLTDQRRELGEILDRASQDFLASENLGNDGGSHSSLLAIYDTPFGDAREQSSVERFRVKRFRGCHRRRTAL